jgi:hypothetical protein
MVGARFPRTVRNYVVKKSTKPVNDFNVASGVTPSSSAGVAERFTQ